MLITLLPKMRVRLLQSRLTLCWDCSSAPAACCGPASSAQLCLLVSAEFGRSLRHPFEAHLHPLKMRQQLPLLPSGSHPAHQSSYFTKLVGQQLMPLIVHSLCLGQGLRFANFETVNIPKSTLLQAMPELTVHDKVHSAPKACC